MQTALDLDPKRRGARVPDDRGIPEGPRELLRQYIDEGRLGVKSERGFYDQPS